MAAPTQHFTHGKFLRISQILGFWLAICLPHALTQAAPPTDLKSYSAEFSLRKKGITIGHISMRLQKEKNTWSYTMHAEPSGIATLFSSDRIHETARIYIDKGRVLPYRYRSERIAKNKQENLKMDYNLLNKTVSIHYNQTSQTLPLTTPLYDSQSLQLALRLDLKNNALKKEYATFEKNEIKLYQFQLEGEETLTTPLGPLKTLKLSRNKGQRKITAWYAPTLNYLPIQYGEYKKGKQETIMKLLALHFDPE